MAAPRRLREDFDGAALRALARRSKDSVQTRRLLALASIYDGSSRTEAARLGGVGLQVIRDWVVRFNADGPDGLEDRKAPGNPLLLGAAERAALVAQIDKGPIPAIHGVVHWRLCDLVQWLWEEFRLSARPRHHAQAADAPETFKKTSPPAWKKSPLRKREARP